MFVKSERMTKPWTTTSSCIHEPRLVRVKKLTKDFSWRPDAFRPAFAAPHWLPKHGWKGIAKQAREPLRKLRSEIRDGFALV